MFFPFKGNIIIETILLSEDWLYVALGGKNGKILEGVHGTRCSQYQFQDIFLRFTTTPNTTSP